MLAALSMAAAWAGRQTLERGLHYAALLVDSAVVFQVLTARSADAGRRTTVPARLGVLLLLGGRANVVASVLDAVQRQLGIDVRSTWALTVVRRSLEPLLIGLLLVGWLSTSVDVVRVDELGWSNVSARWLRTRRSNRGSTCTGRGRSTAWSAFPRGWCRA